MAKLPGLRVSGPVLLEGAIELSLRFSGSWSEALVGVVDPVVRAFLHAGGLGGYGPPSKGAPSRLVPSAPPRIDGASRVYPLWAERVDWRSFQFLRHMLSRPELVDGTLTRMDVKTAAEPQWLDLDVVDDGNEAQAYPAPRDRYGFPVEWVEDVQPSKSRRVLIEFANELVQEDFQRMDEPLTAWNDLLEAGAFSLPFGLPDIVYSVGGSPTLHDAYTAELYVSTYFASEVGFDCLLNLLDAVAFPASKIQNVAIE